MRYQVLTANPTNDRLKFILKTYGAKKPLVVIDMVDIIAATVGEDGWHARLRESAETDPRFRDDFDIWGRGSAYPVPSSMSPPSKDFVDTLVSLVNELPKFKTRHRADPLFPWMATQLAKGDAGERPRLVSQLKRRGTLLAQWYERTRPNLGEYDLAAALYEADEWNETEGPVPQGEVVVELADGWTGQKLTTDEQLNAEGNRMQHCVGSYAREVKDGKTTIYSLRDAKGHPHVTIEVKNDRVRQIKGKQNDTPAKKYQPYVGEFKAWLEENDISTARVPPHLAAYADVLEEHDHDIEEDYLESYAQSWDENTSNAEEAAEWLRSGMSSSDYELVGALGSEDVTPDEYVKFPYAVHRKLTDGGGVPSDLEYLVAVARMANKLSELAPSRDDSSSVESPQAELFGREPRVQPRVPGHDPIGDKNTPSGRMAQPVLGITRHGSQTYWDEWDRYDDEGRPWLYPAEEWLVESFTSDSSDDEYVGPWFIHRFTPETATEWWDVGVESGDLAHELRRRRIRPEMFQGDSPPAVHRSLTEFENLKAKADREWLRRTAETPEEKAASEARRDADLSRYAKAIAQQIAEQFDDDGVRRNPKRTSKRTSRRR